MIIQDFHFSSGDASSLIINECRSYHFDFWSLPISEILTLSRICILCIKILSLYFYIILNFLWHWCLYWWHCTTDQSPTIVVTRHTSVQSSNSTPTPTVSLPKSTKKPNQSSMIKDKAKRKKVNCSSIESNTNQKRGSVPQDEDKTRKKKPNTTKEWKWQDKEQPMTKKEYTLEAVVLGDLDHGSLPFKIFQTVTGMNELLEMHKKITTLKQQRIKWRHSLE